MGTLMGNAQRVLTVAALLFVGALDTYAQLSLVKASVAPAQVSAANTGTNQQYRLESCRIDPLVTAEIAETNRFQLTATLNRVYTDASLSGLRLTLSFASDVHWSEDEITCGYRLQSVSNLVWPVPNWQDVSVQANASLRSFSLSNSPVQPSQFFRLVKP